VNIKMDKSIQNTMSKLQCERQRRGWSRKYVAEQLEVSDYTVGQWERGKHMPYPVHIQKLCNLFDTSADALGLTIHAEASGLSEAPIEANTAQANVPNSSTRTKRHRLLVSIVRAVVVLAIAFSIIKYVIPVHVKPGGVWVSPNPVYPIVGDNIHFAAYAYPTHQGDPAIDYVNFTMYWPGVDPHVWRIACVVHTPIGKDLYTCDVNLHQLGAAPGQIDISFNVFDRHSNVNEAPNGVHHINYVPS
jgi:transcriptional regulator with XRE-family HTH domain